MKDNKKNPTLEKFCHFHDYIPATHICGSCGKSICYYCQSNSTLPYQCPECMPAYWSKKVKRERMICFTPVVIVIILLSLTIIWSAFYYPEDYDEDGYTYLYLENDDIIPTVHSETYNATGNNEVALTLKVYLTNKGTKDSEEVYIELHVMKNGTSRKEASSSKSVVNERTTKVFYINTTLLLGNSDLQLMIWQNNMVYQKGMKSVSIGRNDVKEISAYEVIDQRGEPEAKSAEDGESMGQSNSAIFVLLFILAIPIILIIGWFLYKERTKQPKRPYVQPPAPVPAPPHVQVQPPTQPHAPPQAPPTVPPPGYPKA